MKVLVVEDEPDMRDNIVLYLEKEMYIVEAAPDYDSALDKLETFCYDCIILDIGIPGGTGLDLLQRLKEDGKDGGVIIVSARDSIDDKIKGLNLGADDYLSKPFHMAELHARIKSIIRRKVLGGGSTISFSNLKIDVEQRLVEVDGTTLDLNRKEFDILLYLVTNKNRLVNKTALATYVWGDYIDHVNSFDFIYSQIKNLRKKLKDSSAAIDIQAIYGIGYKLSE